MPLIELADRPDPRDAVLVAELAPERVARIRRIGDHAARPHDIGDRSDRPPLRVGRMDVKVPGHATILGSCRCPLSPQATPAYPPPARSERERGRRRCWL